MLQTVCAQISPDPYYSDNFMSLPVASPGSSHARGWNTHIPFGFIFATGDISPHLNTLGFILLYCFLKRRFCISN